MATQPTFSVLVNTNDYTLPITYQDTYTAVKGHWEGQPQLKQADSFKLIPFMGITTVDRIVIEFPGVSTGTVRLTFTGSPSPVVWTMPAQKIFVYSPTAVQAATLVSIEASVDSVTPVILEVRIFGV